MAYQLRTRPPTGCVPWPLILIEGGEKTGKTWACAEFSKSSRIGEMYWIDLAEGSGDEYGAIPGVRYEMVTHDGTFDDICNAVEAIRNRAEAASRAKELPVVLTIDPMNSEWELLKGWTNNRARGSKSNRRKLAADPNAEIVVPPNYWNDANDRHRRLMKLLMTFPGIVLMTARGKEVAAIENGQPVEGKKDYRVEGHKNLGFDASCWIRLDRGKPGIVVGCRSVHTGIRPGYDEPLELSRDWSIEGIVFDTLRCDPATAHVRDLVDLKPDDANKLSSPRAQAISAAISDSGSQDALRSWWSRIRPALDAGEIVQYEADVLNAAVLDRKAELDAAPVDAREIATQQQDAQVSA